ncbi:hypothetical protein SAMN05192534_1525 [Alteribacillus persepolensis]|uniref:Uncharacterized protein n=1 Tax=Alteribacillus persepolensis TaxID=568899 RepID=A0A1G8KJR2_9BACI|nr:hypothetical protein [Alteribacillus persepolensis]SDI43616.1 hypothetical protein SAMN05192534_1525 [Alteribacillus persepolensis]
MGRNVVSLTILIMSTLLITACQDTKDTNEEPQGQYEDDKMIGLVREVDTENSVISVDISRWEKRDRGNVTTDEGYAISAELTDETTLQYEDTTEASLHDIKEGQKVLINPPKGDGFKGVAGEFILLDMTYEEKYRGLLSHIEDTLNIVVMYEEGETPPPQMDEQLMEKIEQETVMTWRPYQKDYVVDYKEELNIEKFPVILVFNSEELVFKTTKVEKLYEFF